MSRQMGHLNSSNELACREPETSLDCFGSLACCGVGGFGNMELSVPRFRFDGVNSCPVGTSVREIPGPEAQLKTRGRTEDRKFLAEQKKA